MASRLVVKCTWGADGPERANQALTVASVAAASGVAVSLWLTGEGSWFAVPGSPARDLALPEATPAGELLDTVLQLGSVTVCSQCAARRGLTEDALLPGVRIAGSAVFVEESLADDARVLVY